MFAESIEETVDFGGFGNRFCGLAYRSCLLVANILTLSTPL